ncbi:bestrophin family protein, partial [Variovorax sp. HJSM1_2]|uniref:bestrophin family protein n=1 Tax=Variovorax sp. HJSM1_2 TaxID=3366263 RepID=UPI003BB9F0E8
WGELLLRCRNLSRQCQSLIALPTPVQPDAGLTDVRVRMVYRAMAFCHALRQQLRDVPDRGELPALLQPAEWQGLSGKHSKTEALMRHMGGDLQQCLRARQIDGPLAANIDNTLSAMVAAAASCERIKHSPLPFSYTLLLHRTAYMYCFLLPFGLVDTIGFMTPFVVGIVAYTFFGLDALGDEIEEPFGLSPNDLPLDAICRTVEINLRESLGETGLPAPLQPVDYCLL